MTALFVALVLVLISISRRRCTKPQSQPVQSKGLPVKSLALAHDGSHLKSAPASPLLWARLHRWLSPRAFSPAKKVGVGSMTKHVDAPTFATFPSGTSVPCYIPQPPIQPPRVVFYHQPRRLSTIHEALSYLERSTRSSRSSWRRGSIPIGLVTPHSRGNSEFEFTAESPVDYGAMIHDTPLQARWREGQSLPW